MKRMIDSMHDGVFSMVVLQDLTWVPIIGLN